ncbi:hypothetical protein [Actinomadura harenae]|uniref:Uncharacterized protein n=1 Tax=Actinomadura harenae TaxID=2483351 RepID=A0A3M2L7S5_9ACTN|nr:hypothetical protein [Actinomadura harenae]RMI33732.1 hypothetical protein EBO15_41465 [Actinomadura harenae]
MAFLPPEQQPPPFHGPPAEPPGPPRAVVLGLRARQWMIVAAALGCVYALVGGAALVSAWTSLHRGPTNAEIQVAARAEVARRWEAWPAERIFPERISYEVRRGRTEFAGRAGIAAEADCSVSVDPPVAAVLTRNGCRAVLRATYVDQIQGVATTIGVAVFADATTADRVLREVPPDQEGTPVRNGVRAIAFPGTAAARFTDAARQDSTADRGGPYLVLTSSGETDGRPAASVAERRPNLPFAVAPQLARQIAHTLGTQALPDCSRGEWKC